jgi:uncharacterized membrane protein
MEILQIVAGPLPTVLVQNFAVLSAFAADGAFYGVQIVCFYWAFGAPGTKAPEHEKVSIKLALLRGPAVRAIPPKCTTGNE